MKSYSFFSKGKYCSMIMSYQQLFSLATPTNTDLSVENDWN